MTTVVKQHENPNYYICMEIERRYNTEVYAVRAYPVVNKEENLYGYPIREIFYSLSAKDYANRTFNRYKRKYI